MYVGTDEIKAAFYKTVKEFVGKAVECESDLDTDCFSLAYRMEGMIALVEQLTGGEEK